MSPRGPSCWAPSQGGRSCALGRGLLVLGSVCVVWWDVMMDGGGNGVGIVVLVWGWDDDG